MSLQACADLVAKADPDRFQAAMAAPVEARRVLFPIYAFNVEVARAPWVASEPMIGEMRLQWWRDALDEVSGAGPVRKHEVTTPLGAVLDAEGAGLLDRAVAARRWDLYKEPFEDEDHLRSYIKDTSGGLMWAAARALGAPEGARAVVEAFGAATGLVRFLQAVPELEARGRIPLLDGRVAGVRALAESIDCPPVKALKASVSGLAKAALLEGWQTRALLEQAKNAPDRVASGDLRLSEFRRRFSLFRAAL